MQICERNKTLSQILLKTKCFQRKEYLGEIKILIPWSTVIIDYFKILKITWNNLENQVKNCDYYKLPDTSLAAIIESPDHVIWFPGIPVPLLLFTCPGNL